jgi:hypothetical protein
MKCREYKGIRDYLAFGKKFKNVFIIYFNEKFTQISQ